MLSIETQMLSWACGPGLVPPQNLRAELGMVGRTMPVEAVNRLPKRLEKAVIPETRHKIP